MKKMFYLIIVFLSVFIYKSSAQTLTCVPSADPGSVCPGETSQLSANASGGSGSYTYLWNSTPSGFSSTLANPVVSPIETTTYHVTVNDGYNISNGSVTVSVYAQPVPNAGPDQEIPYGTSTTLQGSASSGSGVYNYRWEPAYKLLNPDVQYPLTLNLTETTLFTLTVTDTQTGCQCESPDQVILALTGGPLAVSPVSNPPEICQGASSQLTANVSGGSGNYTYTWTSDPPGFTSTMRDPVVTPQSTTNYIITANDGYNQVTGNVIVTVYDPLEIQASPDFQLCQNGQVEIEVQIINGGNNFNAVWLFQGNQVGNGSAYLVAWSEYGAYAPNNLVFTCVVTDECGNSASDEVVGSFFPVVEITGAPLICLGETNLLTCTPAQSYEWHLGSPGGPVIGNNEQALYYTPATVGFFTLCVRILNDCGELADACYTFEVSELACESDTMSYFGPKEDTLYEYINRGYCGYISGNNCDQDKIKANLFNDEMKSYAIEKVLVRFGKAVKTSPAEVPVKFGIWAESDENGLPGTLLDSSIVSLSQIVEDVANERLTIVTFLSPVDAPKDFFIGVFLPQGEGDTVALMTNINGDSNTGIAWTFNATNEWLPYSSDPRFLLQVSNAIFPIVKQNNLSVNEFDVNPGDYLIFPNPVKDLLHINSIKNNSSLSELLFYDLQGRMILKEFFTTETSLNLNGLDPGVYVLIIMREDKMENYKVVVY